MKRSCVVAVKVCGGHHKHMLDFDSFEPCSSSPFVLDSSQRDHFLRKGYVVLRAFFTAAEVAQRRDAVVRLLSRAASAAESEVGSWSAWPRSDGLAGGAVVRFDPWHTARLEAGQPGLPGDAVNPGRVRYLNDAFAVDATLEAHMRDPRLLDAVSQLLGPDVDAYQSALVVKPPRANTEYHGWHQDIVDYGGVYDAASGELEYRGMSNFGNLATITYLMHCTEPNGSTTLAPSSHRRVDGGEGPVRRRIAIARPSGTDPPGFTQRSAEGAEAWQAVALTPDFAPGDVLLFDSWLAHRVCSNADDESKVGLINVYCRPDCTPLDPGARVSEIGPKTATLPTLRAGRVLPMFATNLPR